MGTLLNMDLPNQFWQTQQLLALSTIPKLSIIATLRLSNTWGYDEVPRVHTWEKFIFESFCIVIAQIG
jgi:hypothetical protein